MGLIPAAGRTDPQASLFDSIETTALSGEVAAGTAEHATIDPNLIVLFFLLGFCLLYAILLALDTLESRRYLKA